MKSRMADGSRGGSAESNVFSAAVALHRQGRLREAEQGYRALLKAQPRHADAFHHLGVLQAQRGRLDEAIRLMRASLAIHPTAPNVLNDLGVALEKSKRLEEAVEAYEQALALQPDYIEVHYNLGNTLLALGRHKGAALRLERALSLRPSAEASNNLGLSLLALGRREEAIERFKNALTLRPAYPEACNNLGIALQALRGHEDAIPQFERALALAPSFFEAQYNLGVSLYEIGNFVGAARSYERAIMLLPRHAKAHNNLGDVQCALGRHERAIAHYRRAISLDPDYADAHYNMGTALQALNRHRESLDWFAKALELKPNLPVAHWNESRARLALGDFDLGWKKFEWRWLYDPSILRSRDFRQPLWLGESGVAGKTLLIHAEQGLGDTLQFCRYVPLLRDRGAHILFEVQTELFDLLSDNCAGPELEIFAAGVGELPPFDLQCPLLSLPLALETTLETIPRTIPYLKSDPHRRQKWAHWVKERMPGLRVGLVWAGNSRLGLHKQFQRTDARRSIRLATYARLFDIPGVSFVSVQKGAAAEAQIPEAGLPILDPARHLGGFADTAGLVENLDLIVSVDTSVAHLAGALGKPVWMLSRFDGCWRWLLDREDSPWYPTLRVFRQPEPGNWDTVIGSLARDLARLAEGDQTVLQPKGM